MQKRVALILTILSGCILPMAGLALDLTDFVWSGAITESSARVKGRLKADSSQVRLVVATDDTFSGTLHYSAVTAADLTTDRIADVSLTGLTENTAYYYRFEVDGVMDDRIGQFHTFFTTPESFEFVFVSCADTGSEHPVFTSMLNEDPLFYICTGDLHYENIGTNEVHLFRDAYKAVLASDVQRTLYQNVPLVYMWDDHDFGEDNSDFSTPAREASRLTYQEYVPHYPLVAGAGNVPIYQSFAVGRVKFILTDLRSEKMKRPERRLGPLKRLGLNKSFSMDVIIISSLFGCPRILGLGAIVLITGVATWHNVML